MACQQIGFEFPQSLTEKYRPSAARKPIRGRIITLLRPTRKLRWRISRIAGVWRFRWAGLPRG